MARDHVINTVSDIRFKDIVKLEQMLEAICKAGPYNDALCQFLKLTNGSILHDGMYESKVTFTVDSRNWNV